MLALASLAYAGGLLTAYPFRIFTVIPNDEPHPGIYEIPSPNSIHSFTVTSEQVKVGDKLEWYAVVRMVFGNGNTGIMQVDDGHSLIFSAQ